MKKKSFLLTISSVAAVVGTFAFVISNKKIDMTNASLHGASCNWHHYAEVAPTLTGAGAKEYWICCDHSGNGPVFSKPTEGKISDSTHPSSFVNGLSTSDSRYLAPYNQGISFEDGYVPSFITPKQTIQSITVSDVSATAGSKSLKITVSGSGDFGVYFSKTFLDTIFSDSSIKGITFDAVSNKATNNFRHKTAGTNVCYENNADGYGLSTQWKKFQFTRDFYTSYADGDAVIYGGGLSSGDYILIDNIRFEKTLIDSYGFENGFFNTNVKNSCYRQFNPGNAQAIFQHVASDGVVSNISFSYDKYSEGYRSLKYTLNGGYCAFYLSTYFKGLLSATKGIAIDVYSTATLNGNTSSGIVDGNNYRSIGSKTADTWQTFTLTNNQIGSDGRFFIIQGSTAGDWYFDNLRIVSFTTINEDNVTNVGNVIVSDLSSSTTLTTKYNIDGINKVMFDGAVINYQKLVGFTQNLIYIDNSILTEGNHTIKVLYRSGNAIYVQTFYLCAQVMTSKTAVSCNATYMANDYLTLSGYSNVYRISTGDNEVAYEISGSDYLIPTGVLIELLGVNNNRHVSGTVNLFIYTDNGSYLQPVNVTVTQNVDNKSIPTYEGEGIATHAYSATSSYASTSNYTSYYGLDKVIDYQNTGLQVMYEQAIGVGANETSLNTALQYLIANCAKVNQKIMLVDRALSELSKSTVSLIGNANNVTTTFSSTAALDTYVENRLKIYINNPTVYGISIGDEQTYAMLDNGYGEVMQSIYRVRAKLNREDFYINTNLLPINAESTRLTGAKKTEEPVKDYAVYLAKYLEVCPLDYIQYDIYNCFTNTATIAGATYNTDGTIKSYGYGINNFGLRQLLMTAEICRKNNKKLYVVTQSFRWSTSRTVSSSDVQWMNNTLLGFGVRHISYFVYQNRAYTGDETWYDDGAMLTIDGAKNNVYYYIQAMQAEIQNFAGTISAFTYSWYHTYSGSDASSAWFYGSVNNTSEFSDYMPTSDSYGDVKQYSVDYDWAMITGLVNSSDQKMYMIQNLHNNFDTQLLQTHTIVLNDQSYNYAIVWEKGVARVCQLGTFEVKGKHSWSKSTYYDSLTLKLSTGHAAFVMFFK